MTANDTYRYWNSKKNRWETYAYTLTDLFNNRARSDLPNYQGAGAKEPGAITGGLFSQAGMQTVTIGNRNAGMSRGSVFIGEHSGYDDKASNVPKGSGNNYVTSVGFQSDATGWGSIAIGSNATAENTKKTDSAVTMTEDKTNNIYEIEKKPTIEGASVALGYSAHSKDGNIAIGSYSDATTTTSKDETAYTNQKVAASYVSVGNSTTQRRITNVADGADATDVATVGQLQALSKELGGYKEGFGIQIDPDSTDKTKNTISLKRNLGTNYTDKEHKGDGKVTVGVDDTGLVLGGYAEDDPGDKKNPEVTYGATGDDSVTVGGKNGLASGKGSVAAGGMDNVASGVNATVVGGDYNDATGKWSAALGGRDNTASGEDSTTAGGGYNVANGTQSAVLGGYSNYALGTGTTSIGGYGKDYQTNYDSSVNGMYSVGIAGGSTGKDAAYALAAGNQAVVTTENGTAIGYQATTDEANTVAFGHDVGDVSGYTIKWKQRTDGKINADNTTNDYTQAPESVTENTYTTAGYNRLVKVADGKDDHDVVVMEQLKDYTKTDASNIGNNIKVYKTDGQGNVQLGDDKKPIEDKNATTTAQNTNKNAWAAAIGDGVIANPEKEGKNDPTTNGSQRLVTGGTVYKALQKQADNLKVNAGWGINVADVTTKNNDGTETTTKNVISLKRNLGTNYGNLGWGEGKVTFEASGQNSLILGGAASVSEYDHNSNVKAGVYGKDSVLVGGFNNLIGEEGETSVIVGGQENQVKNQGSVIVGGFWNKVTDSNSVVVGGVSNEASGSGDGVFGGFRNKVSGMESVVLGGQTNEVTGMNSVVSGGTDNKVSGHYASANGGKQNTISGNYAATLGGFNNQSKGMFSNAIGGDNNITSGQYSITSGGSGNTASGDNSYIGGGHSNQAAGVGASVFGGYRSKVNGIISTGVGGGSTDNKATAALAAGYQSMVTDGGVAYRSLTSEERSKIYKGQQYWPGFSGILADNDTKVLDRISTAIGYQATADAPGVISFGHDKGDESSENGSYSSAYYNRLVKAADGIEDHDAVVMEQLKNASDVGSNIKVYKTDKNGNVQFDKDNKPIEDTSDAAKAAQKASEDAWGKAIGTGKVEATNSQLVTGDTVYNAIQDKAVWKLTTNGEDADKATTIKPGTTVDFSAEKNTKEHSNVTISHEGSNVTIGLDKDIVLGDTTYGNGGSLNVYSDSSDGNNQSNHVSINGSTISVNYPKTAEGKTSDARGVILGVGKEDGKPDGYIAFNNVEGGYTYLHASTDASKDKKSRLEYVGNDGNKKYIANLDDVSTAVNNAKTKYYAVNGDAPLMNLDAYKNDVNNGAKGMGSLAAGFVTHADGIASTVAGSYSGVINQNGNGGLDFRGAAALSYGTFNVNQNTDATIEHSGVANSIIGQVNMTKNSNAAIIYGAGNIVTDSYRPIDEKKAAAILDSVNDPAQLGEAMKDAVKTSGGQVMVMGGGNNVESAYMTQVVGVGNTVKGNQVQNTKSEWVTDTSDTAIKDYDAEKSSQYNYVDGFNNEVINGKHDYVIGANNKLSGDSYDDSKAQPIKRSNRSNIVIGDNHTLTREQNTVIIGSSDTENTQTKARDAVIIGHNANATNDTGADNAVAIGRSAKATGGNAVTIGVNTSAGANSITIGSESSAISGSNIAIGRYARVYGDNVTNAVALGKLAEAHVADGVAIGSGSQATVKGNSVEGYDPVIGKDSTDATATWKATNAAVSIGKADGTVTRQINGLAAGTNDTDAVNVAQLKSLQSGLTNDLTNKGLTFAANSGKAHTAKLGDTVTIQGTAKKENHEYTADNLTTEIDKDGNITILMDKDMSVEKLAVNGKDGKDGQPGTAGSIGIKGQDGEAGIGIDGKDGISIKGKDGKDGVTIKAVDGKDGTEGHIGLTGPAGTNGMNGADGKPGTSIDISVKNDYNTAGKDGKDGINGEKGVDGTNLTRVVYTDGTGEHQIATMEDGLKFKGDDTTVIAKKLNNQLDIIGGADSSKLTNNNIGVNSTTDGKLKVQLADELTGIKFISNQKTVDGTTTGAKITLGDDGTVNVNGGKITNVGSGADASGKYTDATKTNAANIGDVQNIVNDAKKELTDGKNGLNSKANVDASNIGTNLAADKQQDNLNNWGKAIGTGKVEANNGQLVTGKTVYDEVRPKEDGNYVKTNQTTGENLSALDNQIGKLDKDGNYIKKEANISQNLGTLDNQVKTNADAITNINSNIGKLSDSVVKYDGDDKSKVTLAGKDGTTITNVKDGELSSTSTDAVNGKQLYQEQQDRKDMKDLSDAGKTVIRDLAKGSVKVVAGKNTTVTEGTDGDAKTYAVNVAGDGKVESGNEGLISGGTLYNEVHVDKDGSYIKSGNTVSQNLSTLDTGLKTTSDLIHTNTKGDTIQIGGNSTATKIDVSGKDGKGNTTGRVITGVVSDANDPNSAANVGYVNGLTAANTQQIYRDMNNAYSRLDTNINRAAAGSNALAALHPLDFDPADKASFAVGYGHYHNANAAAVGAFYQPNANTMVNMGISLGNGDPGFNAGVSFKIGKGSTYNGVSKAEMAQTIHDQAAEISTIKANDAAKDKRIDALEKENQEMKKQIQEILARLNG